MGKAAPDYTLDGSLERIAEATRMYICADQPADYAGIAALALAQADVTAGVGNGDFTIGDAPGGGRRLTVAAQADMPIGTTGEGDHVVLADVANSRLLYVTETLQPVALTSGGTVDTPAWNIDIADPQ